MMKSEISSRGIGVRGMGVSDELIDRGDVRYLDRDGNKIGTRENLVEAFGIFMYNIGICAYRLNDTNLNYEDINL